MFTYYALQVFLLCLHYASRLATFLTTITVKKVGYKMVFPVAY